MQKHPTSLVEVAPGETVTVRQILFDTLRAYCAERGLHEGDRVTLVEGGKLKVLFPRADGTVECCPPDLARFVEVVREPED